MNRLTLTDKLDPRGLLLTNFRLYYDYAYTLQVTVFKFKRDLHNSHCINKVGNHNDITHLRLHRFHIYTKRAHIWHKIQKTQKPVGMMSSEFPLSYSRLPGGYFVTEII